MEKRYIEVEESTGRYLGHWVSQEVNVDPHPGRIILEQDVEDEAPVAGDVWNGTEFIHHSPPVKRLMNVGDFMDRFPFSTQVALETLGEQQTQVGRVVRIFTRRLQAQSPVDLDSPTLRAKLEQFKALVVPLGTLPGWTTNAEADASIQALLQ